MREFSKQNQPAKTASVPFARLRSASPQRTHAPDQGTSRTAAPPPGFDFSRIAVHGKTPVGIQTKLTIGPAGDAFEQEADRVAEQVMRAAPERTTLPAFASSFRFRRAAAQVRLWRRAGSFRPMRRMPGAGREAAAPCGERWRAYHGAPDRPRRIAVARSTPRRSHARVHGAAVRTRLQQGAGAC